METPAHAPQDGSGQRTVNRAAPDAEQRKPRARPVGMSDGANLAGAQDLNSESGSHTAGPTQARPDGFHWGCGKLLTVSSLPPAKWEALHMTHWPWASSKPLPMTTPHHDDHPEGRERGEAAEAGQSDLGCFLGRRE